MLVGPSGAVPRKVVTCQAKIAALTRLIPREHPERRIVGQSYKRIRTIQGGSPGVSAGCYPANEEQTQPCVPC